MFAGFCYGQKSISGQIKNAKNNQGIPNVSIYVLEINTSFLSDSLGYFTIANLKEANYTLHTSHIGFQSEIYQLNLSNPIDDLVIKMDEKSYQLEEVVISSAYTTTEDKNVESISVIKKTEMEQSAGHTIMDAIIQTPGVNGISTGPLLNRPQIRGLSGNRILTVVDGLRFETQQWDDEHGIGVNELGIDRIEIIKGPASLLYGPEAMGGVIHFVEEQPAEIGTKKGNILTKIYSNNLGFHSNLNLKGANKKYNWGVNTLGRITSDYFYDLYDFRVPNTRLAEFGAKGYIGVNRAWGSTKISYLYSQAYYGILDGKDIVKKPDGSIVNTDSLEKEKFPFETEAPFHSVSNHRINSNTTLLLKRSKINFIFGFQNNHRKENEEKAGLKKGYEYLNMNLQSSSYNLKWYLPKWKNIQTIVGSQAMYEENQNKPSATTQLIPNAQIMDFGILLLSKYQKDNICFSIGARYDTRSLTAKKEKQIDASKFTPLDKNYENVSYSFGASYTPLKALLFRVNIASAYRSPNLNELSSNGFKLESQRFEIGNPNFKKETNQEIDLTIEYKGKNLSIETQSYFNQIQNYIHISPTGNLVKSNLDNKSLVPEYKFQQDDSQIYGGEFILRIHPRTFTFLEFETRASTLTAQLVASTEHLYMMPSNQISNKIIFYLGNIKPFKDFNLIFGNKTVFKQTKVAPNELETPEYTLFNMAMSAKVKQLNLNLSANNIFDRKYLDHLSRFRSYDIISPGLNITFSVSVPIEIK